MKITAFQFRSSLLVIAVAVLAAMAGGCANLNSQGAPGSFASVRPVIETNCVQCHGVNRLAHMPAFTDTRALAKLIGPTNWIIPGQAERSHLFQVVSAPDQQPGAMPPTGHAISKSDVEKLRAWIQAGAPLPEGAPIALVARGEGPRSQ